MEESVGAQIFWMITLGLTLGFIGHYVFGKRGVPLLPSMIVGLTGALVTGIAALLFGFTMAISYSLIGTLGFLFVVNAFREKDRHAFIDTDRSENDDH